MMSEKIVFIGAGSVRFTLRLLRDIAITPELSDSFISLMDVDEKRLDAIYKLAQRIADELGSSLEFEKTTVREEALQDADFVLNNALAKGEGDESGYEQFEIMRSVGNEHGYYRGIEAQNFNRVSDYYTFTSYHQLKLALDIAKSVENICPDAWLLNTSNPNFEITQLVQRKTEANILGICHGFNGAYEVFDALGLDSSEVDWQVAGVNHGIWLNRFRYDGEDAYPLLDEWIEENASDWEPEDPWDLQMSPAALDMYDFYGKMPIGDTPRNTTWKYHYNLATKRRWYGKFGGIDNDLQRKKFYNQLNEIREVFMDIADKPQVKVTEELLMKKEERSDEQHIPIINALANGVETRAFPNIPNSGIIDGIPEDVVVEVPAKIDEKGVHPEKIEPENPRRIKTMYLRPRILKMEWALEAFNTGDRRVLEEVLVRDPRTNSFGQVKRVWDEIMDLPFNKEMKEHYEDKSDKYRDEEFLK